MSFLPQLGKSWPYDADRHQQVIELARRAWYEANYNRLVKRHGNPQRENPATGKLAGINENYWAGAWALQNQAFYDPLDEIFYRYDSESGLWLQVTEAIIKQEVADLILQTARTFPQHADGLEEFRRNSEQRAVVSQLRGLIEQKNPFEDRPQVVHLANCCISIDSGIRKVHGFSPIYLSRNRSPIPYCPGATCRRFIDELVTPAVHPEDVELIQMYMGQCLLGTNLTSRMLILDGGGGEGKSQLAKVIRGITGRENTHELRTEQLNTRFETYRFLGKTLLLGVDVQADFLSTKGASELKKLTGGDPTNPEKKAGNGVFDLMGWFCVVITSNTRLKLYLRGDHSAWRRRLLVVRYAGVKPKKKIAQFAEYLLATEGAGILNWVLEGLEKFLSMIAVDNDFVLTPRQQQIVDDLIEESESLRIFVEQCLLPAPRSSVTTADLTLAYVEYCRVRGWAKGLKSKEIIYKELADLMVEVHGVTDSHDLGARGTQRGYRGVKLISDASDAISIYPPLIVSHSPIRQCAGPSEPSVAVVSEFIWNYFEPERQYIIEDIIKEVASCGYTECAIRAGVAYLLKQGRLSLEGDGRLRWEAPF